MKKQLIVVTAVLAVVAIFVTAVGPVKAQGITLALGIDNLSVEPNPPQTWNNLWTRILAGQGGPCIAQALNGAVPDTWHYGQSTQNLQGSPVCNYNDGHRNLGGLVTPTFLSGAAVPVLRFQSFLNVESGSSYDIAEVQLSLDGGTFSRILLINKARMNVWDPYETGLSACAGHACQVKFFFDTVDANTNRPSRKPSQAVTGWWVANFSIAAPGVATATPTATATVPSTPTATATPTSTPGPGPSANWDAWPQSGPAPLVVSIHIVDLTGVTSCSWDYGDGSSSTNCTDYHNHTFTRSGNFSPRLAVTGPSGSSSLTLPNYVSVTGSSNLIFLPLITR